MRWVATTAGPRCGTTASAVKGVSRRVLEVVPRPRPRVSRGEVQTYHQSARESSTTAPDTCASPRCATPRGTEPRRAWSRSDPTRSSAGGSLRISAACTTAGGQGYWPRSGRWAHPAHGAQTWPATAKIDLMETSTTTRRPPNLPLRDRDRGDATAERPYGVRQLKAPASRTGFHTYSMIWDSAARKLTYQLAAVSYFTVGASQVGRPPGTLPPRTAISCC